MKVLQFLPRSLYVGQQADYIDTLVQTMHKYAEVFLATDFGDFRQLTAAATIDIVHVHGAWNRTAAHACLWAVERKVPAVLSLHGGLHPWIWNDRPAVHALMRHAFLEKAVRQADAVQVDSPMELARMEELSWNPRTCLIRNAQTTHTVSASQMVGEMVRLYQKVIDSNTFRIMTEEEKQTESQLLRVGLCPQDRTIADYETAVPRPSLPQLSDDSWRKIFLHANDEQVLPVILHGAEILGIPLSHIDMNTVERFPQKLKKADGPLPTDHLLARHAMKTKSTMDHLRQDEKPTEVEQALCHMFLNIQYHLRHHTLSRLHLTQLFSELRFSPYDEDKFLRMAKRLSLDRFVARLMQILHESLALEEGYMPVSPLNDKETERLRRTLKDLNIQ